MGERRDFGEHFRSTGGHQHGRHPACDRLAEDEGIDPARLDWRQERGGSVADAIVGAAEDYDLLVVGESEPSLTDRILGDVTDDVIDESSGPLLIVRDT
ncbi:MAG: universal stress protein [Halorubrum sp.]|uniref:universal stress protein n=1 Tax=Halorubrum sp. TaxID=1879286 RepID=UPI003970D7B9